MVAGLPVKSEAGLKLQKLRFGNPAVPQTYVTILANVAWPSGPIGMEQVDTPPAATGVQVITVAGT